MAEKTIANEEECQWGGGKAEENAGSELIDTVALIQ